jgi:hypothetical protein
MKLHYFLSCTLAIGSLFTTGNRSAKENGSLSGEETESVTLNGKMSACSALTIGNTFLVTNVLDLTEGRSRNRCQSGRS